MRVGFRLRVIVLMLAGLLAENGLAMWVQLSEQELSEGSDLIVTGTLTAEKRAQPGAGAVGVIRVDQVLKGATVAEALLALPAADRPISSSDIVYRAGQAGLWYLRLQPASDRRVYLADHPQRFVPIDRAQQRIESLRKTRKPE